MYDPVTDKVLFDAAVTVNRVMSNQWVYLVLGMIAVAMILTLTLLYIDWLYKPRRRVFRERF